jgi:hypothetical protein
MPRSHSERLGSPLRRALVLPLIGALWLWACSEAKTVAETPDASSGPLCEPGTQACLCSESGGCDPGLLCITGRCFRTQGGHDPEDPAGPTPLPPPGPPAPPAPPSGSDAGNGADSGPDAADASADASLPPVDAAPPIDAASDANP